MAFAFCQICDDKLGIPARVRIVSIVSRELGFSKYTQRSFSLRAKYGLPTGEVLVARKGEGRRDRGYATGIWSRTHASEKFEELAEQVDLAIAIPDDVGGL
jgi:hypothetical protein